MFHVERLRLRVRLRFGALGGRDYARRGAVYEYMKTRGVLFGRAARHKA